MFALAAIVAFAVALICDLAGFASGHWNAATFTAIGLLSLAVHLAGRPAWLQRGNPPQ
jgi:hypothetical protein